MILRWMSKCEKNYSTNKLSEELRKFINLHKTYKISGSLNNTHFLFRSPLSNKHILLPLYYFVNFFLQQTQREIFSRKLDYKYKQLEIV